jgi:membrane-bound lytic murein transglycosylase D
MSGSSAAGIEMVFFPGELVTRRSRLSGIHFNFIRMNRSWPIHWIMALCGLMLAALTPVAHADGTAAESTAESSFSPDIPIVVPKGMQDLMNSSQAKYREGLSRIRAGDSDRARESFNQAVDQLLQSDWDIPGTPVLNRFFQTLIRQIETSESQYLPPPNEAEEEGDPAMVDELEDLDSIPATIDPSVQNSLIADLSDTKYDIPITINEMVAKSLDYWLNSARKHFVDGLLRSGQYRSIIEKIFREESVPLDLMYLAQVESLFKPHAVSRAKAKGIWQFEKGTAIRYGLKVTRDIDERADPEKSTRAAARYLNDLFAIFKDWNLVLAAYNWGEGKVQRLINSTGFSDFWQLVDLKRKLPAETKNHVPLIQASIILGRNAEKLGLPTELDPPLKYEEVSVSKPIDLRAAAKVLRTSTDELKKLNPSLRGLTTPANYPDFQLKVPIDSDPDVHARLAALPTAKVRLPSEFSGRYKVRKGDTLSGIAARYHVTVAALQEANNISTRHKIRAGAWIQVPTRSVSSKASRSKQISSGAATSKPSTAKSSPTPTARAKNEGAKKAGVSSNRSSAPVAVVKAASPKSKPVKKSSRQMASR